MTELAVGLGLVFMFFCMGFVMLHSKRSRRVTLLDWAVLGMGGIYGGGWALVVFVTKNGGNPFWAPWLLPFESMYPAHTLNAFILLGSVYLGWILGGSVTFKLCIKPTITGEVARGRLVNAAWILLFIAMIMQWLYVRAYGGFIEYLDVSALIRSGIFPTVNNLSFLLPFGGLAIFSSFLFFGLWLDGVRKILVIVGFILSFLFSLYVLFSWLGRIIFLVYLSTFVIGVFLKRRVPPLPLLFWGGLVMLGVLFTAYHVSTWLNLKPAHNLVSFLVGELSFPFGSFFAQANSGENLMRLFRDFLYAPLYILPSSWWSNWVENVSQVNTVVIMGAPKGVQGVTGGIPVDLLTLGLMQAASLGIVGVGLVFGSSLRLIQRLLDKVQFIGVRSMFGAYIAVKFAVLAVFYAQPELVVAGNFDLLVSVIIITCFVVSPRINLLGSAGSSRVLKSVSRYKSVL